MPGFGNFFKKLVNRRKSEPAEPEPIAPVDDTYPPGWSNDPESSPDIDFEPVAQGYVYEVDEEEADPVPQAEVIASDPPAPAPSTAPQRPCSGDFAREPEPVGAGLREEPSYAYVRDATADREPPPREGRARSATVIPSSLESSEADAVLLADPLLLPCPYCGMENQRVGSRCANERCDRVIVRVPVWAQHRRLNWFARRLSWRRITSASVITLLIVFVIWIFYPFVPNPLVLFANTQTQQTIDQGPGSWSAVGRDLRHSRNVAVGPPAPAGQLRYFNFEVPGDPLSSEPVLQDTHVYVGSSKGVYALSQADLTFIERWEGDTPGKVAKGAAVAGLNLFFGSSDGTINSWSALDGQVRWSFPAEAAVHTSPVVSNGLVFIASGKSWVYALDAHNGTMVWRSQLDSNASDAVVIHEGRLYVGDDKGVFYVLSARTGNELFRYRTPRSITGSPVISSDGERAYFASGGQLYAVKATINEAPGAYQFKQLWSQLWFWQVPGVPRPPGQEGGLWRFTPENPLQGIKSSPALAGDDDGTVYAGAHDNHLYALDAIDGTLLWSFEAEDSVTSSPLVVKEQVIFGDAKGNLFSLNRNTGLEEWRVNLGAGIHIAPVIGRGLLIVRTEDGNIYGLD